MIAEFTNHNTAAIHQDADGLAEFLILEHGLNRAINTAAEAAAAVARETGTGDEYAKSVAFWHDVWNLSLARKAAG